MLDNGSKKVDCDISMFLAFLHLAFLHFGMDFAWALHMCRAETVLNLLLLSISSAMKMHMMLLYEWL